jgi:trimeric autotransporter adhesin
LIKHIPQAANAQARLWQNNPNPYSQSTTIQYLIPAAANSAFIKVYSSTGQELQSFDLTGKTQGELTIAGRIFPAGTYVYTLFVDGVRIDSKKLVLTQ